MAGCLGKTPAISGHLRNSIYQKQSTLQVGRSSSAMGKGTGGQRHDCGDLFPFFLVVDFPEGPDEVAGSTRPATKSERVTKGWRNKCEFTIGRNESGEVEVGFILKIQSDGAQVIGSVQDVPLVPAAMQQLCSVVAVLVAKSSFPIYDRRECGRSGVWRTVLARCNPAGDMLVMVQTTTLSEEDQKRFVEALLPELQGVGVTSVFLLFNDEVTDAPRPNAVVTHVHGKPRLEMPMLGLKLEVGPLSFFNPNTTTCRFLMETAIAFLNLKKNEILLDIFCGIGTIGLCAAHCCDKVIGVDIVEENIQDARRNAEQNSITNTEFLAGKAEDLIPRILGDMDPSKEVVAVVDPSRAGTMHSKRNGHRALSEQEFQSNLELLDLVVGTWVDQFESTYSVQLDGGLRQDSCSVFTMRKNGRTLKTRALIRVKEGKANYAKAEASRRGDLQMRPDGFVEISTLSTRLRERQDLVDAAVQDNRRFECHRHGTRWVRAVSKHSSDAPIDRDLLRLSPDHCFERNPPGPAVTMGTMGAGYVGHGDLPPVDAPPTTVCAAGALMAGQLQDRDRISDAKGIRSVDRVNLGEQVPVAPAAPNGPSRGEGKASGSSDGRQRLGENGVPGVTSEQWQRIEVLEARVASLDEENRGLRAENDELQRQLQDRQAHRS
eukprot:s938_g17.t3